MRQNALTSVTSVCTSVITVTRLVTVTACVAAAPLDFVINDGVDVVIARLAALALWLDDVSIPDILAIFASLPIFTMPCEPDSGRVNDPLAFITVFNHNPAIILNDNNRELCSSQTRERSQKLDEFYTCTNKS